MLSIKLNPNLFDVDVEQKPTRDGYGSGLTAAGEENPNVMALSADLKESTRAEEFARKFPERFIEVGVAEQNMVTVASGLAASGKIPFVSSYATFSPGRNWEQIRTTICYNDANVKIAGHHTGLSVGPDGATHQALEDIALMRVLPNMMVIVPCDSVEADKATRAAAHIWGPIYLRFGREKTPVITTADTPFTPGKAEVFWESPRKPQVVIIACGSILGEALKAAVELQKVKIGSVVLNCHTVKPLDRETILRYAKKIGQVVTVEEHQAAGGLGGAVAELLTEKYPVPLLRIGVPDRFGESGTPRELFKACEIDAPAIVRRVTKFVGN